jgi:hypothetical protein
MGLGIPNAGAGAQREAAAVFQKKKAIAAALYELRGMRSDRSPTKYNLQWCAGDGREEAGEKDPDGDPAAGGGYRRRRCPG